MAISRCANMKRVLGSYVLVRATEWKRMNNTDLANSTMDTEANNSYTTDILERGNGYIKEWEKEISEENKYMNTWQSE